MPNVDQELEKARESKFYAHFDMTHGYWQFLVHSDDQETQSIITPDGIFTPRRLLHGNFNANSHLQASLVSAMSPRLKNRLLLWVDDMVIPGVKLEQFLSDICDLLDLCAILNLKLHPGKCHLYRTSVVWCGRELSPQGIRYDPRQLKTLEAMPTPSSPSELLHFSSAMQWLRQSVPNFTSLMKPLLAALERA